MILATWTISGLRIDRPILLLVALLILPLALLSWRWMRAIRPVRRILAIVMRSAAILVLTLALAGTNCHQQTDRLQVFFLVDRSLSVTRVTASEADDSDTLDAVEQYLRKVLSGAAGSRQVTRDRFEMTQLRGGDEACVILFDGRAYVEVPPDTAYAFDRIYTRTREASRTNIAAAMSMARGLFKPGYNQRIVLITDGVENAGNAMAEALLLTAQTRRRGTRLPIEIVRLEYDYSPEVLVERLELPARANKGQTVWLRAVLRTRGASKGELILLENGRPIDLNGAEPGNGKQVELSEPLTVFRLPVPMESAGLHHFELRFRPAADGLDQIPENNLATGFCFVKGMNQVLVVDSEWAGRPGAVTGACAPFAAALDAKKIGYVGITPGAFPSSLAALQTYDAVILSNVPADQISKPQQEMLERYVHDFGGGLIMVGGPESFGAGDWMGTPVEKALPVTMDIRHIEKKLKGALVLIMHSTEMPEGNYWGKRVAKAAVRVLTSKDDVGIIHYDYAAGCKWAYKLSSAGNKPFINAQIDKMQMGDMPDFQSAMVLARDALKASDAATKHMIIISDGDPSPPTKTLLNDLVNNRITCSTVGIGFVGGYHVMEAPMRAIAKWCKGKYYPVRKANRLPTIFVREAKRVRRPLITEKPFVPVIPAGASRRLLKKLDAFHTLHGIVLTTPKPKPLAQTPLVRPGEKGGGGDPVLAHWGYGVGTAAALTSEYKARWAKDWVSWEHFATFWDQVIRVVARGTVQDNIRVETFSGDVKPYVEIEALDEHGGFLDDLTLDVQAVGPDLEPRPVEVSPVGPGRYRGYFAAKQTGDYFLRVKYERPMPGGEPRKGIIVGGYTVSFSPEFRHLSSNDALLERMAAETSGRIVGRARRKPTADGRYQIEVVPVGNVDLFHHDMPPLHAVLPIWDLLILIVVGLFLTDVFLRRVMIDWRRVWATLTAWQETRQERREARGAIRTLGSLQRRRKEVAAARKRPVVPLGGAYQPPEPTARDVSAAEAAPRPRAPKREEAGPSEEGGTLAERLRRAKQRARRQMEDDAGGDARRGGRGENV